MNVITLTASWAPVKPVSPLIAEEWTMGDYRILRRKGELHGKLLREGQAKPVAGGTVGSLKHHGAVYWAEKIASQFKAQQEPAHEDGDVQVDDQGTIVLFRPVTEEAQDWIAHNVEDSATWLGGRLVVEHRYAPYMIEGMLEAGLEIKRAA